MDLRAILVCVDYWDYLQLTVPHNRHHFSDIMVVTSPRDERTLDLCSELSLTTYVTDAFYAEGADFNKWLALENALDVYGRHGWLCIMDADVLWPKKINFDPEPGYLYTPHRRMCTHTLTPEIVRDNPEEIWTRYMRHPVNEFSGYSQIFHADDPVLGDPPWHQTDWKHAGGADSFFQMKWSPKFKIRPDFDVLHLGPHGTNWCGRVNRYVDGSTPVNSTDKRAKLRSYISTRRMTKSYDHERLDND